MNDLRIKIAADGAQQTSQALNSVGQQLQKTAVTANVASAAMSRLPQSSGAATQSLINLSRVAQDAPYGFIGIANNLNPLLEGFQRLKAESGSTKGALSALRGAMTGPAGIGLAVGVVSSLLVTFGDRLFGSSKAAKAAEDANLKLAQSISGELVQLTSLVAMVTNVNAKQGDRVNALKALNQEYGKYLEGLGKEEISLGNISQAYDKIIDSILKQAVVKGLQQEIEQAVTETAKAIIELEKAEAKNNTTLLTAEQYAAKNTVRVRDLSDEFSKYSKNTKDGQLAQIGFNNELQKTNSNALLYENRLSKLKDKLKQELQPLFGIISKFSFGDLGLKLNKVTVKPDEFELLQPGKVTGKAVSSEYLTNLYKALFSVDPPKTVSEQLGEKLSNDIAKLVKPPKVGVEILTPDAFKQQKKIREELLKTQQVATFVGTTIADAFGQAFDAAIKGENVFKALGEALKQLVLDLIKATIQTIIFKAVAGLFSGGAAVAAPGIGGALSGIGEGLFGRSAPALSTGSSFGTGGRMVIRGRELRLLGARTANSQIRLGGR